MFGGWAMSHMSLPATHTVLSGAQSSVPRAHHPMGGGWYRGAIPATSLCQRENLLCRVVRVPHDPHWQRGRRKQKYRPDVTHHHDADGNDCDVSVPGWSLHGTDVSDVSVGCIVRATDTLCLHGGCSCHQFLSGRQARHQLSVVLRHQQTVPGQRSGRRLPDVTGQAIHGNHKEIQARGTP